MKNKIKLVILTILLITSIIPFISLTTAKLQISAVLDDATPEAIAGKQVIIRATLKNNEDIDYESIISIYGNSAWSSLVSIQPETITLYSGESKQVSIVLNINKEAEGDKEFTIRATSGSTSTEQRVALTITNNQVSITNSLSNSNTNSQMITCYYFDGTGNYCLSRTYFGASCPDSYYGRKLFSSEYQCNTEKLCPAKETRCSDGTCQADPNKCPCPSGQIRCSDNICKTTCETQKINLTSSKEKATDNSVFITIAICFTTVIIVICLTLILMKKK